MKNLLPAHPVTETVVQDKVHNEESLARTPGTRVTSVIGIDRGALSRSGLLGRTPLCIEKKKAYNIE